MDPLDLNSGSELTGSENRHGPWDLRDEKPMLEVAERMCRRGFEQVRKLDEPHWSPPKWFCGIGTKSEAESEHMIFCAPDVGQGEVPFAAPGSS